MALSIDQEKTAKKKMKKLKYLTLSYDQSENCLH